MNNVRTGVRSVWKRSWTFLGVILQRFGSERDKSSAHLSTGPVRSTAIILEAGNAVPEPVLKLYVLVESK